MMSSTNVLILNVFNIYQEQSTWNGRLREESCSNHPIVSSFEDVIELTPKDGVWEAAYEEIPAMEPHNPRLFSSGGLTYNRHGGFTSSPATGARINVVV